MYNSIQPLCVLKDNMLWRTILRRIISCCGSMCWERTIHCMVEPFAEYYMLRPPILLSRPRRLLTPAPCGLPKTLSASPPLPPVSFGLSCAFGGRGCSAATLKLKGPSSKLQEPKKLRQCVIATSYVGAARRWFSKAAV